MSDNNTIVPAAIPHIRIPRSLIDDPLWQKLRLKHQVVFETILAHVRFKPCKFDDGGHIIELLPGQFCASIREIQKLCHREISKNDLEGAIKKLISCGFLRQEVRHFKTILTISHQDTYELIMRASQTIDQTAVRQYSDSSQTQKKNGNNVKKEKNTSLLSPVGLELAIFLFQSVKKLLPESKEPNFNSWAKDFEHLINIDKRTPEQIREMILWLETSHPDAIFWRKNIRSPKKLREKWEDLLIRRKVVPIAGIPKTNRQYAEERFKHKEKYGVYECFINDKEISFVAWNGHFHAIKFNENGFASQLDSMCRKLNIQMDVI